MLLAGEFLASVGVMVFDVNQNSLIAMLDAERRCAAASPACRASSTTARGRSARCSAACSAAAIGLRPTMWIGVVGCLLGVLFLLASPMPRTARGATCAVSRAEILRHRPLRALLAAEVISTTGAQMTWLALPWFVLDDDRLAGADDARDDRRAVGFAAAGLPSGDVLQRLGARRTMLLADAVRAPLMLLVPVLHWSGHLSFSRAGRARARCSACSGAPYFAAQRVIVPGAARRGRARR